MPCHRVSRVVPGSASASRPRAASLGWKLTFGVFLWHWIYGYFLGTVYCPSPKGASVLAAEESTV
jgi:hypothetical protein